MASELSKLIESQLKISTDREGTADETTPLTSGAHAGGERCPDDEDPLLSKCSLGSDHRAFMGALRVEARVRERQSQKNLLGCQRVVCIGGGTTIVFLISLMLVLLSKKGKEQSLDGSIIIGPRDGGWESSPFAPLYPPSQPSPLSSPHHHKRSPAPRRQRKYPPLYPPSSLPFTSTVPPITPTIPSRPPLVPSSPPSNSPPDQSPLSPDLPPQKYPSVPAAPMPLKGNPTTQQSPAKPGLPSMPGSPTTPGITITPGPPMRPQLLPLPPQDQEHNPQIPQATPNPPSMPVSGTLEPSLLSDPFKPSSPPSQPSSPSDYLDPQPSRPLTPMPQSPLQPEPLRLLSFVGGETPLVYNSEEGRNQVTGVITREHQIDVLKADQNRGKHLRNRRLKY